MGLLTRLWRKLTGADRRDHERLIRSIPVKSAEFYPPVELDDFLYPYTPPADGDANREEPRS